MKNRVVSIALLLRSLRSREAIIRAKLKLVHDNEFELENWAGRLQQIKEDIKLVEDLSRELK